MDKIYLNHIRNISEIDKIDSADLPKAFAEKVSRLRVQNKLTQDDMAYLLGIHKATYVRIEAGTNTTISAEIAMKLANILKTPLMNLFGLTTETIDKYGTYMKCTDRTKRLIGSIMEADVKAQESFSDFDKDDLISMITFSEEIHDGVDATSILHSMYNISCYKNECWYPHADALLEINSNAYHPLYHIGNKLVITNRAPRNGEIGVYVKNFRVYIRRNVESPETTALERVNIPIYTDLDPMIVNRRKAEDMKQYTKLGVVIAVI